MVSGRYTSALPLMLALAGSCHDPSGTDTDGVTQKWYRAQIGYSNARPTVLGSLVYFGTGDGQIIARDVNSGGVNWATNVANGSVQGANLIARGDVVVAPVLSYTVGLDASTGRELWRYAAPDDTTGLAPGTVAGPGSVAQSRIDADATTAFIPAWGASLSAVDLHSGAVQWVWRPGAIAGDTAASGVFRSGSMGARVSGDTVFATVWHYLNQAGVTSEAWVIAIDRITGAELWRVRLPYQGAGVLVQTAPVVYKNLVIAHTLSGRTYAIDRLNQSVSWEFTPPGTLRSTTAGPELFGDAVYVDGGNGRIYGLRAGDGGQLWSYDFQAQTTRDMLATSRRVLFTQGNLLHVLDRLTGSRVAVTSQPNTNDPLFASAPAFSNGLVFIGVADGAWCFEEP
jgi:outer membrane protein assembly factor BamB